MKLVIRHGILSNAANMKSLAYGLGGLVPGAIVDNADYVWEEPILRNGVELALALQHETQPVVLVGHSMGGLVCRVANCALTDPHFLDHVRDYAKGLKKPDRDAILNAQLSPTCQVRCIITLATPNSGAMTYGQMAVLANIVPPFLPLWMNSEGVHDLRTDRTFRVLQHCHTKTPCLTVSGSWGNRFQRGAINGTVNRILKWAASLRDPHDKIVEDISVDLHQSILPHEFVGATLHLRAYPDCIDVEHTNIHEKTIVHKLVASFIKLFP